MQDTPLSIKSFKTVRLGRTHKGRMTAEYNLETPTQHLCACM